MFSVVAAPRRRRSRLVASLFPVSILTLTLSQAKAQQPTSPTLLPTIEVNPPKKVHGITPAPARQTSATTPQAGPSTATAPIVVGPTATEMPAGQVASSLTVITRTGHRDSAVPYRIAWPAKRSLIAQHWM